MIFNMIQNGGGGSVEIFHGSLNKQSGSATFTFNNLAGKPKFFAIYKIANSTTKGFCSFAALFNGAYIGQSVTGDESFQTRNKSSNASWDEATHTFSINLWNSYGNYEYYYII